MPCSLDPGSYDAPLRMIHSPGRNASGSATNRLLSMEALLLFTVSPHTGLARMGRPSLKFGGLMKLETAFYKALVSVNVSEENATAVIDALEEEMSSSLATKNDVALLRAEMKADGAAFRSELVAACSQLEVKLTVRMGIMLSAFTGIVLGSMKYLI